MHESVQLECPVEFINITPMNPLISKCEIKVCYVSDKPNRNKSVITKDVAREMANSLPGSPIVGYYNEETEDFEEHNRSFEIVDGEFVLKDTTRPYGFVDLNAKCWFAKFLDDNKDEREYLMTEGYLWTGQYPEAQRAIDRGNNQSMELDEKTLKAHWAENSMEKTKFFIINEAVISKLCILGEDYEPCFEGASVTAPKIQFSLDDGFKEQMLSMMNELTKYLNKEEQKVFTKYSVTIGDTLWTALYAYTKNLENVHEIVGVYEDGEAKFAVLRTDDKYLRLDFSLNEDGSVDNFNADMTELDSYVPDETPQFSAEEVAEYVSKKKKEEDEDKKEQEDKKENEDKTEDKKEDKSDDSEEKDNDESDEEEDKDKKKKKKFSYDALEEIPEYVELMNKYSALVEEKETLVAQNNELLAFRSNVEKKDKEKMIQSFYMLSDEDKHDVIENIDKYSIDEIEAKLSILCVRNKVNFSLEEEEKGLTTYSFDDMSDDAIPAWVKSVRATAKSMN